MTATEPLSSVNVTYSPEVATDPKLHQAARAGTVTLRELIDGTDPDIPMAGGPITAHWRAASGSESEPLVLTLTQGESTRQSGIRPEEMGTGWGAFHLGLYLNEVLGAEIRRAIRQMKSRPLSSDLE